VYTHGPVVVVGVVGFVVGVVVTGTVVNRKR
jgi:hypothetical protein